VADGCGRIVAVALTPGNMADITMAVPLLEALALGKRLIADKAYDADRLRDWLQDRGIEAVIPGRAARAVVYPLNRVAYRRRNIIERMFGRLKNWKRIATRYDRLAVNYLAAIVLVATVTQWLG
jgi:transposase